MAAPLQPAGVRAVAEGVDKYVGDMQRMGGATADMGSRLSQMATIAGGMIASQVFTRLADAFMSVARGAVEFGKESVLTAARVQELDAVLLTIGRNAGVPKSELDELVESIKDLGIRTDVAQTLLIKFSRFQLNFADATKLARLAQDAAVISMQDSSEALDGLIHGITVMNTRVLRTYGITLASVTDAQDKYAEELGTTRDKLNETQMIQAVLNAVLAQGSQIAGAYEAAMETAGKQMRSMSRHVKELMINIGKPFLGAFSAVIKEATNWIKYFREITEEGTVLNRMLKAVASVVSKVVMRAFNRMTLVFEFVMKHVSNLWEAIEAGRGIWGQLGHVVQLFMNRTKPLHGEILPRLFELFQHYLLPVIEKVMKAFVFFARAIAMGAGPVHAMIEALSVLVPRELVPSILKLHKIWDGFVSSIREFLDKYKDEIVAGLKAIGLTITIYIVTSKVLAGIKILGILLGALTNPIFLLLTAIGVLGIAWSKNFGGIQDKLAEFWETTGRPIFEKIRTWLEENIPKAIVILSSFWEGTLQPALEGVWNWVKENVFPIIEELVDWLSVAIPQAIETAGTFWKETLQPALEGVWLWVKENVFPIIQELVAWLQEAIPTAVEFLRSTWEEKLQGMGEATGGIIENILGFFEGLRAWFTENWPVIQAVFLTAWEVIKANVQAAIDVLRPHIERLIESFRSLFTPERIQIFKEVIVGVMTAVGAILQGLFGVVVAIIGGVADAVSTLIQVFFRVVESIKGIIDGFKMILKGDLEGGVIQIFKSIAEGVANIILGLAATLVNLIAGIVETVINFFINLYYRLVGRSLISDIVEGIIEAFSDLATQMLQIGKDIITGLWDGLKSIWEDVKIWFDTAINDIVGGIADLLGLDSPSRLFESIGQDMMAGLAKGIQGAAQLPTIAAQVALSQQVMPAVAGVTRNQEFNLNVSTSAPTEPIIADFQMLALLAELS